MEASVLAALAEPNRLRIVELLADAPRTVGEIASALDLRQPQVSKHLQTLQRAEVVEVQPLGRRRVCALRHGVLEELSRWAGRLANPGPDDAALARYRAAIESADLSPVIVRRTISGSRAEVWRAFTEPTLAARWWHPRHFTVAGFRLDLRRGGAIELALREGDGAEHLARGRVLTIDRPRELQFTLDPIDIDGAALFTARHNLQLNAVDGGTEIELVITPSGMLVGAEAAVAGLEIGWEQLIDNLAALADGGGLARSRGDRPRRE
jgi:uncharacterized protein YndB with AHSA1/START domain/DNA-binding transcriptional ArsR family regulator